ncbi:chromate transporter [Glaciimonas immobilis]|uniref:Chromate transporter n=1 Tax=Glaciimonas immobilis TaxID=728004 RepID=A0A840RVY8_9BURK|nr:chromate transporter [Glaciimonas immobilis]KAF3996094.1 chromate transporter [Glaciimonas immobilis]MBB5201763.1 chromate transporter [Glaciimonas immobilis]
MFSSKGDIVGRNPPPTSKQTLQQAPPLSRQQHQPVTQEPPTVPALFRGFLGLGLIGFGGVLPLARRMLVDQRGWLTGAEFTDLLGLCQFLPGGNIINLSVAVGLQFRGIRGAIASLLGLIAAPTAIVIGLGIIYARFQNDAHIAHMFAGLAAAAAGLLVSTALKMAAPLRRKPLAIMLASAFFLGIAVLRLPLLPTMLVLVPVSVLVTWRWAA